MRNMPVNLLPFVPKQALQLQDVLSRLSDMRGRDTASNTAWVSS